MQIAQTIFLGAGRHLEPGALHTRSGAGPWAVHLCSALAIVLLPLLGACGDGGGDAGGGGGSQVDNNVPGVQPVLPPVLHLAGIAANGAALANTSISIKCSSPSAAVVSASATTDADGNYSIDIIGARAPCMLQAPIKDGSGATVDTLHSMTTAAEGDTMRVNITSLSDNITATALNVQDPSAAFASFGSAQVATLQAAVSAGTPAQAWTDLKTAIAAQSINGQAMVSSTDLNAVVSPATPITQVFSMDNTGHSRVLTTLAHYGVNQEYFMRMRTHAMMPPLVATGHLNDTGVAWCTENITTANTWKNDVDCSTLTWDTAPWGLQQDAYFGRDQLALAGSLAKVGAASGAKSGTGPGPGVAVTGFDYTRIGSSGKALLIQNGTWSDTGSEAAGTKWDCVRDNVTGLVWEVKRKEQVNGVKHLRHMDHTYTWYSTDSNINGGNAGTETGAGICTGVADPAKCNTQAYVTAVNAVGLCGARDWRMPTADEMASLSNEGNYYPAIDTANFPNTAGNLYWVSNTIPSAATAAYTFQGISGMVVPSELKSQKYSVRLVRAPQ